MIFTFAASLLIGTAMLRTQSSARLVNRSGTSADLRAAAEGELERCYLKWKMIKTGEEQDTSKRSTYIYTNLPTTATFAEIQPALTTIPANMNYNSGYTGMTFSNYKFEMVGQEDVDGLLTGSNSGTSTRGKVSNYKMIVQVTKKSSSGNITFSLGRMFTIAKSSAFKSAIFYDGAIEMCPGGNMTVNGDIFSNNNIYLGSRGIDASGNTNKMIAAGSVSSVGALNLDNTFENNIGYTVTGATTGYYAPLFPSGRDVQASRATQSKSFLDGVNISTIQAQNPTLFPYANDVNHAIIDPPPASGVDPMSKYRIANQASLVATVKTNTSTGVPYVQVKDSAGNDYTSTFASAFSSVRKAVDDNRQGGNVSITTLDVALFNSALSANTALSNSTNGKWNGIIYMTDSATSGTPAFRLDNGNNIPQRTIAGKPLGFTAATNTGMYIQGDYNTTADGSTGKVNRCAVVADAITGLSNAWDDSRAADPNIFNRPASATTYNTAIVTGDVAQKILSTNPDGSALTADAGSGDPHNLVRLLEDWKNADFNLKGSLVQLFQSKTFNAPWVNQGQVYKLPTNRTLEFDTELDKNPLEGFATVTVAKRGEYFVPTQAELDP